MQIRLMKVFGIQSHIDNTGYIDAAHAIIFIPQGLMSLGY